MTSGGQGDPQNRWEGILATSHKKLNKVCPAFKQFYKRKKHLRIKTDHIKVVDGVEVNLGTIVNGICSRQDFPQHADFKAWLHERGFVYNDHRAHFELNVWPAFKQFYNREKHLRIRLDVVAQINRSGRRRPRSRSNRCLPSTLCPLVRSHPSRPP